MAVTNHYETVSSVAVVFSRAAAYVQDMVNFYQSWKAENATRAELLRLSDAELDDIGLSRHQIRDLNLKPNA